MSMIPFMPKYCLIFLTHTQYAFGSNHLNKIYKNDTKYDIKNQSLFYFTKCCFYMGSKSNAHITPCFTFMQVITAFVYACQCFFS